MFGCARSSSNESIKSPSAKAILPLEPGLRFGTSACKVFCGMPSCKSSSANCPTSLLPYRNSSRPESSNSPSTKASTFCDSHTFSSLAQFSFGTPNTMRSCASLNQISQGCNPGYFSSARSSWTFAPKPSLISPTALEKPPAPQSVSAEYKPSNLACRMTSWTCFSVIGLPI